MTIVDKPAKTLSRKIFDYTVYFFAIVGFAMVVGYLAIKFGFTNTKGIVDDQRNDFRAQVKLSDFAWSKGEEWDVLKSAIIKDKLVLEKSATDSGIPTRLIVAVLAVEQLRLYHSEREIFKKIFAPLRILGNQNQFSLGVMGIKLETAKEIEDHLKDVSSPYYLGKKYEHLLEFTTDNEGQERLERLTNEKDRYYSYLYSGLALKQIESQWKGAGFNISNRPEILSTLYNIGFEHSIPNSEPKSGGAEIDISGKVYSFGQLAGEFYYSDELLKEFPR